MNTINEQKYITFSGLSGGVGKTTMAILYCSYLKSIGKNPCLFFESEEKYNEVKELKLDYNIINLNKETDVDKNISHLVFVSSSNQSDQKEITERIKKLDETINFLLLEPTCTQAKRLNDKLSDIDINYQIIINKILTKRKTHIETYNRYVRGFNYVKNRMNYELVLNGENLFGHNANFSGLSNLQKEFLKVFKLQ